MTDKSKKYMNPYLAGFLLGIVLLASFYFTGRGLGASGAVKSTIVATVSSIAPEHAGETKYYVQALESGEKPLKAWLVYQVLGVLFGGLISGVIAGRMKLKIEHSPKIQPQTRLIAAAIGGILFGVGSQLGRGCTSGAALSGMATLSLAGFVSMLAIFGTAFAFAYFFRKLWI
jgi:uncharacterized protein